MIEYNFDYAKLHDVENEIIKKAQQQGIMRSSKTNLMRAPTPLSQTSSKAALLKKTYRASSARFRVHRQQRNHAQHEYSTGKQQIPAKTLSPAQSAANVRFLHLRKDSLEPRMLMGETQASMTTTAITRAPRPTTAGRTTRGNHQNMLGNLSSNLSVSGFKFAQHGSSRQIMSTNSTGLAAKK
mmetsp:Transcript_30121/g.37220  ORF Transcript_30121/g.37220 Transcript_30121/m.37220 type:complete len:183 (-) Transcript_30121:148-696(-)